MTPDDALTALLIATRNLVSATPALRDFTGPRLERLGYARPAAQSLPVADRLPALMPLAAPATAEITFAVLAAAPHLHWQQSYSEAQVGAHYLANYGWFNLVSPEGPYVAQDFRISVGYWEQGLTYPQHAHAPEEIYCVLAGGATFASDGRAAQTAGAGELIHHAPNQMHGFAMEETPLLAMAFWKGDALTAKPTLAG